MHFVINALTSGVLFLIFASVGAESSQSHCYRNSELAALFLGVEIVQRRKNGIFIALSSLIPGPSSQPLEAVRHAKFGGMGAGMKRLILCHSHLHR